MWGISAQLQGDVLDQFVLATFGRTAGLPGLNFLRRDP